MDSLILNIRPVEVLLLKVCRLSFNDKEKDEIQSLLKKITDWNHFIWLANEHGVIALVYNNLNILESLSLIKSEIRDTLWNLYLKSLARNTFLVEKFIELQQKLADIGIEAVVLKGMALEPAVYGNKGLRQMTDIDIFIDDKNECLRAWNHLKNSGYKPKPLKSPLYNKILLDFGKHLPDLYRDGISIDLHHSLFDNTGYRVDTIKFSNKRLKIVIPDHDIHFLYLVKHLNEHELKGESQLRLYIDLLQIMMSHDANITSSRFIDIAEELGLKTALFEKLFILHQIWEVPLDKEIKDRLPTEHSKKLINVFLGFLRDPKGKKGINQGLRYRKTIKDIPTLKKKLIYIRGDIFPSVSFMQDRYNVKTRTQALLYYPVRLGKILLLFLR